MAEQEPPEPTSRFSDRVADYVRYRPGYPDDLQRMLVDHVGLGSTSVVADVGSGTGISSGLFLQLGCQTNAVEPNDAMRTAAEQLHRDNPHFRSISGTAEATKLPQGSQDCVAAGQAFHWFDLEPTRREFKRILKPHGHVALFWNERLTDTTQFLVDYEQLLLDFATDYTTVDHRQIGSEKIDAFLGQETKVWTFPNLQEFDYEGLQGRLLSSSYVPNSGPVLQPMLVRLKTIFEQHAVNDRVVFEYATLLYIGQFDMA